MLVPFAFERFVPAQFAIRPARADWEVAGCFALRRAVFCEEQRLFREDDRDEADAQATMLAAIGLVAGMADEVAGTVRLHEAAPGHWTGSRLAVRKGFRRVGGIGTGLIRLAVGTARARGAASFQAHVQVENVELFRSLDWRSLEEVELHGRPHHRMQADLAAYPPVASGDLSLVRPLRDAA